MAGSTVDILPAPNLYPGSIGQSLGMQISAYSRNQVTAETRAQENMNPTDSTNGTAAIPAPPAHLLGGLLTFAVLLFVLMWTARKIGEDANFSNVKSSAYNVLVISLSAAIGLPILKMLFTKFRVPGVSAWVSQA